MASQSAAHRMTYYSNRTVSYNNRITHLLYTVDKLHRYFLPTEIHAGINNRAYNRVLCSLSMVLGTFIVLKIRLHTYNKGINRNHSPETERIVIDNIIHNISSSF